MLNDRGLKPSIPPIEPPWWVPSTSDPSDANNRLAPVKRRRTIANDVVFNLEMTG